MCLQTDRSIAKLDNGAARYCFNLCLCGFSGAVRVSTHFAIKENQMQNSAVNLCTGVYSDAATFEQGRQLHIETQFIQQRANNDICEVRMVSPVCFVLVHIVWYPNKVEEEHFNRKIFWKSVIIVEETQMTN